LLQGIGGGRESSHGGGGSALEEMEVENDAGGGEESGVVVAIVGRAGIICFNQRSGWQSQFESVAGAWAHNGL
jgi:hypothetical protein